MLALALALTPAPLLAQAPPPRPQEAAAKASFDAGQKLYDQRKFADALVLFRTAKEASGSPNAGLMIAHCLLELGAVAGAHDELQATMRAAAALAPAYPKYARTRDTAATELAALERRVGQLVIVVMDAGPGAVVTINGSAVPSASLGVPFAVAPGDGIVELTGRGVEARELVVERFERAYLAVKLREHGGNVSRAAQAMGISRQLLHRLMERYGIRVDAKPR